jgi:inner membrane protein
VSAPRSPRLLRVAAPMLACLSVAALDLILAARPWSIPAEGALDEVAHLLTAWIVLNACARGRTRAWPWVLLGAVVIDLDHIPLYLGMPVAAAGGRPVTHSLVTVLVLLAVAGAVRPVRAVSSALAAGVVLHLLRDAATGPGVPLLWLVSDANAHVPHGAYLLLLGVLALLSVVIELLPRKPRPVRATTGTARDAEITPSPGGPH